MRHTQRVRLSQTQAHRVTGLSAVLVAQAVQQVSQQLPRVVPAVQVERVLLHMRAV